MSTKKSSQFLINQHQARLREKASKEAQKPKVLKKVIQIILAIPAIAICLFGLFFIPYLAFSMFTAK